MSRKTKGDPNSLVLEIPEAGAMLGHSRWASYEAAKRGDIPTIQIGPRRRVVPKAVWLKRLAEQGLIEQG